MRDADDRKLWSKYRYEPWQRVELQGEPKLDYARDVVRLVDSGGPEVGRHCLDRFAEDECFRVLAIDHRESEGGCWARNRVQELYRSETCSLQVDFHTRFAESWDVLFIRMIEDLPGDKPLITGSPPLYMRDGNDNVELTDLYHLNIVPTAVAESWSPDGWIHHPHQRIVENDFFQRATRFLSAARLPPGFVSGDRIEARHASVFAGAEDRSRLFPTWLSIQG